MTEQEEQLLLMSGNWHRISDVEKRYSNTRYPIYLNPKDKVDYILTKWPELKPLYNYSPTVRVGVDALSYATSETVLLEVAVHILTMLNETNSMLMKAVEQGFKPHD